MKKRNETKTISFCLSLVLIVAMALMSGCKDQTETSASAAEKQTVKGTEQEVQKVGEGATEFAFTVVDGENETMFTVCTNREFVGEALLDAGLIQGEQGDYGLYVKTVNGVTYDYDTDGKYWAFYVNDTYAVSGVDTTKIVSGEAYSMRAE